MSGNQGRVRAAPAFPEVGFAAAGRAASKPLSTFVQWTRLHLLSSVRQLGERLETADPEVYPDLLTEDRRRIAADVHDLVMQDLAFAVSNARALADGDPALAQRMDAVVAAGERALAGARDVVDGLVVRDREPVSDAVEASVRVAARKSPVAFHAGDLDASAQPDQATYDALVHIGREAVTNAVKHGGSDADVEVVFEHGEEWRLTVRDKGQGFDPSSARLGFGLQSMRAHVHDLGGSLRIDSSPGFGSTVEVTLP